MQSDCEKITRMLDDCNVLLPKLRIAISGRQIIEARSIKSQLTRICEVFNQDEFVKFLNFRKLIIYSDGFKHYEQAKRYTANNRLELRDDTKSLSVVGETKNYLVLLEHKGHKTISGASGYKKYIITNLHIISKNTHKTMSVASLAHENFNEMDQIVAIFSYDEAKDGIVVEYQFEGDEKRRFIASAKDFEYAK